MLFALTKIQLCSRLKQYFFELNYISTSTNTWESHILPHKFKGRVAPIRICAKSKDGFKTLNNSENSLVFLGKLFLKNSNSINYFQMVFEMAPPTNGCTHYKRHCLLLVSDYWIFKTKYLFWFFVLQAKILQENA